MSSWVHMTAVLVIDEDVNFDNLGSHARDEYWHCCGSGESVASLIQKLLVAPHEHTGYAPVSDPIYHITWYGHNGEVEEERNVGICKEDLEAFVFPPRIRGSSFHDHYSAHVPIRPQLAYCHLRRSQRSNGGLPEGY